MNFFFLYLQDMTLMRIQYMQIAKLHVTRLREMEGYK